MALSSLVSALPNTYNESRAVVSGIEASAGFWLLQASTLKTMKVVTQWQYIGRRAPVCMSVTVPCTS
jgi:hypothetical protein